MRHGIIGKRGRDNRDLRTQRIIITWTDRKGRKRQYTGFLYNKGQEKRGNAARTVYEESTNILLM